MFPGWEIIDFEKLIEAIGHNVYVRNWAEEYAKVYKIDSQKPDESSVDFRIRVAKTLFNLGYKKEAHIALENNSLAGGDPFAVLGLDRGYGEDYLVQIATLTESGYQYDVRQARNKTRSFFKRLFNSDK